MKIVASPSEPRLFGEHFEVVTQIENVPFGLDLVPSFHRVVPDLV